MERIILDPEAPILQLGVVEVSVEITGVYMRVRGGEWLPVTYGQMWCLAVENWGRQKWERVQETRLK